MLEGEGRNRNLAKENNFFLLLNHQHTQRYRKNNKIVYYQNIKNQSQQSNKNQLVSSLPHRPITPTTTINTTNFLNHQTNNDLNSKLITTLN
jgi:hypothetical protein